MSCNEKDIIRGLQFRVSDLEATLCAKESGMRLLTIELRRMELARYKAEYNYASVCLTRARERVKRAEKESRG